ncbi:MAG: hypothetical protein R6V83_05105 [Candidatus Thorarchaeota archaeon]
MNQETQPPSCENCSTAEASHMCKDCGAAICADCIETDSTEYIVCSECHHTVSSEDSEEQPTECPECDSDNLSKGRRMIERCPHCHSTRLVLIEKRRGELSREIRKSVMTLQYGHTKLREFGSKLDKAKRDLVSLRMANFLHYKWLESKIEQIHEEMPAIKRRIGNKAELVAKQIAAETKGLMVSESWSPSQFPFIEGVSNRIRELGNGYKHSVDEALDKATSILKEVNTQIDGLNYYRKRFSSFYENADLSVKELPVCALPEIKLAGSDFLKNDKACGTLYMTNKRLVFIAETGHIRKSMEVIFDFPLVYHTGFSEEGRLRKRMVMKLKQGDIKFECSEQTEKVLPDYIQIAKQFDRYVQTDLERVRKLEQQKTNSGEVRLKIERLVYQLLSGRRGVQRKAELKDVTPRQPRISSGFNTIRKSYEDRMNQDDSEITDYRVEDDFFGRLQGQYHESRNSRRENRYQTPPSNFNEKIRETIKMLRNGQIVPENFIRRYRSLMRESYEDRHGIQSRSSDRDSFNW